MINAGHACHYRKQSFLGSKLIILSLNTFYYSQWSLPAETGMSLLHLNSCDSKSNVEGSGDYKCAALDFPGQQVFNVTVKGNQDSGGMFHANRWSLIEFFS